MPKTITKDASNSITYVYDATGMKLKQITAKHDTLIIRYYAGNFEYDNVKALSIIRNEEGMVTKTSSVYIYEYYIKDHLGSIRVEFKQGANGNAQLTQRTDYYPFGLAFSNQYNNSTSNKYLYNGKELQDEEIGGVKLDWYDYGARFYDPQIGRWNSVDPMAEKYLLLSPYNYCADNPIRFIDPDGKEIWIRYGKKELQYCGGQLYNKDGSAYSGKVKGFLKFTVTALGQVGNSRTGLNAINQLETSANRFTIVRSNGDNSFKASNVGKAAANLPEWSSELSSTPKSGSGGTIYWNPSNTQGGLNIDGSTERPAFVGLAHEMFHGTDADKGQLYPNFENGTYTNSMTGFFYRDKWEGVPKGDYSAVSQENQLRGELGIPLRASYGYSIDYSTGTKAALGPSLINAPTRPWIMPTLTPIDTQPLAVPALTSNILVY